MHQIGATAENIINEMDILNRRAVGVVREFLSMVREKHNGSFDHVLDNKNFKQAFLKAVSKKFELAYDDFVLERKYFDINNNQNIEPDFEQPDEQEKIITIENEIKEENADENLVTLNEMELDEPGPNNTINIRSEFLSLSQESKYSEDLVTTTTIGLGENPIEYVTETPDEPINLNPCPDELNVIESGEDIALDIVNASKALRYFCERCWDEDLKNVSYDNGKSLYNHWLEKHAKSSEPFLYFVGFSYECYHCSTIGSFQEMILHFKNKHSNANFVLNNPLDAEKCALCGSKDPDLREHFWRYHKSSGIREKLIFDPVRLTKETIDELTKARVHQKCRCKICHNIYDSTSQVSDHSCSITNKHDPPIEYDRFYDEQPPSIICGFCKVKIGESENFETHFEKHKMTDSSEKMLSKGRTKIVHGNGLILYKCNFFSRRDEENCSTSHEPTEINQQSCNMPKSRKRLFIAPNEPETPNESTPVLAGTSKILNTNKNQTNAEDANRRPTEIATSGANKTENVISVVSETDVTEETPDKLKRELQLQINEFDSLFISGIPIDHLGPRKINQMFLNLCKKLGAEIVRNDIKSIFSFGTGVSVQLWQETKRNEILNAYNSRFNFKFNKLMTNRFLKLKPSSQPKQVSIHPKLTRHFQIVSNQASRFRRNDLIFSWNITKSGLAVKVYKNGPTFYVKSLKQLTDTVNIQRNDENNNYFESSPIPRKRMKRNK